MRLLLVQDDLAIMWKALTDYTTYAPEPSVWLDFGEWRINLACHLNTFIQVAMVYIFNYRLIYSAAIQEKLMVLS